MKLEMRVSGRARAYHMGGAGFNLQEGERTSRLKADTLHPPPDTTHHTAACRHHTPHCSTSTKSKAEGTIAEALTTSGGQECLLRART